MGKRIETEILSVKIISNVSPDLARELKLKDEHRSIGIITTDSDDVSYSALDEATKKAEVEVVYASSFYGGAANANTKLAGEFIGILGGPNPAEVESGVSAALDYIRNDAFFEEANEDGSIIYFAHCISRTGSYLSKMANIPEGEAIAYLIAPPLESMYALDAALKAADVELVLFYGPPTETNFGGGLLTGSQSACMAACNAFKDAVKFVANNPISY